CAEDKHPDDRRGAHRDFLWDELVRWRAGGWIGTGANMELRRAGMSIKPIRSHARSDRSENRPANTVDHRSQRASRSIQNEKWSGTVRSGSLSAERGLWPILGPATDAAHRTSERRRAHGSHGRRH